MDVPSDGPGFCERRERGVVCMRKGEVKSVNEIHLGLPEALHCAFFAVVWSTVTVVPLESFEWSTAAIVNLST